MSERRDYFVTKYQHVVMLAQAFADAQTEVMVLCPTAVKGKDARLTLFSKCINVCVSSSLGLCVFLKYILDDQWWQGKMTNLDSEKLNLPSEQMRYVQDEFQQFLKLGFVHFFYSTIES
jgi:hypothetical protein